MVGISTIGVGDVRQSKTTISAWCLNPTRFLKWEWIDLTNPQSNFNLSLFGQSDSAEVELIADDNHNGQVDYYEIVDSDYGFRNYNANIRSNLGYGSYFIRVFVPDYDNSNTGYTLNLSATNSTMVYFFIN